MTTPQLAKPPSSNEHHAIPTRHRSPHPWLRFAIRRFSGLLLSFVILIMGTFLIVPLIPGDPAVAAAGEGATPAHIDQIRTELGLNYSLWQQFGNYVGGVLTLDLGRSFTTGADVTSVVAARLPFTAEIAVLAMVVVLLVGVPLGMAVAALTQGGQRPWADRLFNFGTGFTFTVPHYLLATLMVLVFAITLGWFPSGQAQSLSSLVLPTVALAVGPACVVSRVVRREAAVVLEQDYIRTARGWRITQVRLMLRYALPNLLTTTLTLSGLVLAGMLGGAVVIETVFSWPGLGSGIVTAILNRDYPVIRAIILLLGMISTLLIILVDVLLAIIDPRQLERKPLDD